MTQFKIGDIVTPRKDLSIDEMRNLPKSPGLNPYMAVFLEEKEEFTVSAVHSEEGEVRWLSLSLKNKGIGWTWDIRWFQSKGVMKYIDEDII